MSMGFRKILMQSISSYGEELKMALEKFNHTKYRGNKFTIYNFGKFTISRNFYEDNGMNFKYISISYDSDEKILAFQFTNKIDGNFVMGINSYGVIVFSSKELLNKLGINFNGKNTVSFKIEKIEESKDIENYSDTYEVKYGK